MPLLSLPLVGPEPAGASQWEALGAVLPALSDRWGKTPRPQPSWSRVSIPARSDALAPFPSAPQGLEGQWVLTGLPRPPCPRRLLPAASARPAAASPEFTHINVKAFLLVWGLEIRSAGSCRLWEVRKPLLALRPPPTRPSGGAEMAAGGLPRRGGGVELLPSACRRGNRGPEKKAGC